MAVVFKSGDLRRKMTFQVRSAAQDTIGGQSTSWTDAFTVWVDIEPITGRELFAAQGMQTEVSHTISARYRTEFSDPKTVAAMRGVYNGRIFNLQAVMNLEERNRFVEILASEALNDG